MERGQAFDRNGTARTEPGNTVFLVESVKRPWILYDACACVEGFDGLEHTEEEYLSAWQYLVDTGAAWTLQGWYGRTAQGLIESGQITNRRNR